MSDDPKQPEIKQPEKPRAVAFFDGQNLYRHAKDAFGHHHPNYDPIKLTDAVCAKHGWIRHGVRFYTGTPSASYSRMWHGYWANRLLSMRRNGILVISRPLRYTLEPVVMPNGTTRQIPVPQEKGIDVRLALDVIRLTLGDQLDVALIFSQDQDLSEVVEDVKEIAASQKRWVKVACAFPIGGGATSTRGIDKTDWIEMDQAFYDKCLDPFDYRPPKPKPKAKT